MSGRRRVARAFGLAAGLLGAGLVAAQPLDLPEGWDLRADSVRDGALTVPAAPIGAAPASAPRVAGEVRVRVFQTRDISVAALAQRIEEAARAAGYEIALACDAAACGGFDFRFAMDDVTPPPEMYVDLGRFAYLAARRDGAWLRALVSAAPPRGFVEIAEITPSSAARPQPRPTDLTVASGAEAAVAPLAADPTAATEAPEDPAVAAVATPAQEPAGAPAPAGLVADLETRRRHVLEGVAFDPGSTRLASGASAALAPLRDWLVATGAQVILVGHTDATGSQAANARIARARAEAVRTALIGLGVPPDRMETFGAGFLVPRASNETEEGRARNRRVEVVWP